MTSLVSFWKQLKVAVCVAGVEMFTKSLPLAAEMSEEACQYFRSGKVNVLHPYMDQCQAQYLIETNGKKILFRNHLTLHKNVHYGIRIILRIEINIMKLKIQFEMLPKYCSTSAVCRSRNINKLRQERVLLKN